MSKPKPILFAHFGLDWITGAERCLLDLVQHVDKRLFKPIVVCNADALAGAAREAGATVYSGSRFSPPDRFLPSSAMVAFGHRIVQQERIALIHANAFEHVKWLLPCARRQRIPMVLHVHLPSTEDERCYSFSHQVCRVVGSSQSAVAGFRQDGLRDDRITVIYNGVDPRRLADGDAKALRKQLGISSSQVVLGVVGSLIERKNQQTLIEALQILVGRGRRDIRMLLIGGGPDAAALEASAEARGVAEYVRLLGSRSDAVAILRDAVDIAVTAAREEVFPLNVLEAGYVGLPIVASDISPHREGVCDGITGFLVPTFGPREYADAIERLADSADLRSTLGHAARRRVLAEFLMERYVDEFTSLYLQLLSASPSQYGWIRGTTWPTVYNRWVFKTLQKKFAARHPVPTTS